MGFKTYCGTRNQKLVFIFQLVSSPGHEYYNLKFTPSVTFLERPFENCSPVRGQGDFDELLTNFSRCRNAIFLKTLEGARASTSKSSGVMI